MACLNYLLLLCGVAALGVGIDALSLGSCTPHTTATPSESHSLLGYVLPLCYNHKLLEVRDYISSWCVGRA